MRHINALVPMAHVLDVERSIDFYTRHLGFSVCGRLTHAGRTRWASLESSLAQLMLAAASGPVDAAQQAVLFYLYTSDVAALRKKLLDGGLMDGGEFRGCDPPGSGGRCLVFAITYPDYMPKGEIRVADPDGYCLLIGQSD